MQLVCVSRNAPPSKWPTLCRVGRWTLLTRCDVGAISYVDITIRLASFRLDKLWNQLVYLLDKTSFAFVSLPSCLCRFFRWGLFLYTRLPIRRISVAGNQHPISKNPLPAVAMIGWHVARRWAAGDGGGARSVTKMASTFRRLVMLRSFRHRKLKLRVRFRFWARIRVGLGLGLGASESFVSDCRQWIAWDRLPVAGYGYTTLPILQL